MTLFEKLDLFLKGLFVAIIWLAVLLAWWNK